jgi:hypothetical protein
VTESEHTLAFDQFQLELIVLTGIFSIRGQLIDFLCYDLV